MNVRPNRDALGMVGDDIEGRPSRLDKAPPTTAITVAVIVFVALIGLVALRQVFGSSVVSH